MTPQEKSYLYSSIGNRIKGLRKEYGLSQDYLAKKLNKSRASVVNIEQGRQSPSVHLLIEIARMFGARIDDLIPSNVMARSEKDKSIKRRMNLMVHDKTRDFEDIESDKVVEFLINLNSPKK